MVLNLFLGAALVCSSYSVPQNDPLTDFHTLSPSAASDSIFSANTAAEALDAFNNHFYDTKRALYYSTTEKKGLGSIWTQAIFLDIIINAYKQTENADYLKQVNTIYQGASREYDGYNWNNKKVWFIYDDMMWWVIALTNAYNLTGNDVYLQKAEEGFAHIWAGSYDTENGGMFWDFKHVGKNACINYPTVIAAMKLYNATENQAYFNKAKEIYSWSRVNLFDAKTGRVADHKIGKAKAAYEDYTYNQGTCIGAAVLLYEATGSKSYLNDANAAAKYTKRFMCDKNGILPAEGDWNEQGVLKAIFAQYIHELIYEAGQKQYIPWIKQNMLSAWQHRDKKRTLMYRNYKVPCPTGTIQSFEASSGVAFMQLFNKKFGDNEGQ